MVTSFARVIVPLDGSASAEKALEAATRLARCAGATLHLVRAVPTMRSSEAALAPGLARPTDHIAARADAYLRRTARRLHASQLAVETTLCRGSPADCILEVAERDAAAIVLLCSRGRTSRTRWLLGSVASEVARRSPVPVLLVRADGHQLPNASPYTPLPRTALRVMVPLDGSPAAEEAIGPALRLLGALAAPGRGRLHLVHVVPAFGGAWGLDEASARAYLQALGDRAAARVPPGSGHTVTWSLLFETEVAPALARHASSGGGHDLPINVIAMATVGQGGAISHVLGGVTEQVLRASRLPVVLVRPRDAGEDPGRDDTGERSREPSREPQNRALQVIEPAVPGGPAA